MLDITTIATGSTGNCYRITDGQSILMIEAGIPFRRIREAFDFDLSGVAGCLLSHCHGDHAKAVSDILAAGVDCYTSAGTAQALELSGHRLHIVSTLKQFRVGTFTVLPFPVQHDAQEPMGFLIQSDNGSKLLFATDTYYIRHIFTGLNYILVEANYRREILEQNIQAGLIPPAMRNRIIKSHFEIENVKTFLGACDLSQCREIHLIHISKGNGDPKAFVDEVQAMTGIPTFAKGVES